MFLPIVTPTTKSFSIFAIQPSQDLLTESITTVDRTVSTGAWRASHIGAGASTWTSGPIDASAGAALQREAEAFITAHPHQSFSKLGVPYLVITTPAGSASYPLVDAAAKQLFDDAVALAHR